MEILLALLVITLFAGVYFYNRLVKSRNYVKDAWAGIQVQLTKRHDLVPMLAQTVKTYAAHETNLLQSVTELRTPKVESNTDKTQSAEQTFGDAFSNLLVLAESYPQLRADENFRQLQQQLVDVEADIESARRYYNGAVREFNIAIESFPSNLIASNFNFKAAAFFELRLPSIKNAPSVTL